MAPRMLSHPGQSESRNWENLTVCQLLSNLRTNSGETQIMHQSIESPEGGGGGAGWGGDSAPTFCTILRPWLRGGAIHY